MTQINWRLRPTTQFANLGFAAVLSWWSGVRIGHAAWWAIALGGALGLVAGLLKARGAGRAREALRAATGMRGIAAALQSTPTGRAGMWVYRGITAAVLVGMIVMIARMMTLFSTQPAASPAVVRLADDFASLVVGWCASVIVSTVATLATFWSLQDGSAGMAGSATA